MIEDALTTNVVLKTEMGQLEAPPSCVCGVRMTVANLQYEMGNVLWGTVSSEGPGFICPIDGSEVLSRVTLLEFIPQVIEAMESRGFNKAVEHFKQTLNETEGSHRRLNM